MAVQRPSRRLHRRRSLFYPLTCTEHGSQPFLTTRDRELVSALEVRIKPGDLNQRHLTQQSVTLPTVPVLSVLAQFLSNRSQHVVVDGCRSKLVNVVSGVLQGSVLGPQLFLLYTAELFSVVENKLYGYADDSTLVAVVPSHGEWVAVSESMNRDLNRVSVWCNLWGTKLNASKTKTMIVSWSRTVHPQLTQLNLDETVLKESADLVVLWVTFDAKMTFEKHLLSVSTVPSHSAAAQRLGIIDRKSVV